MRSAHGEVYKVGEEFLAITGAWTAHDEFYFQHLKAGIGIFRDWRGHGPDGGARGVEVICRRREHPVFQLGEHGTLAFGFLDLVEAIKIRMPGKFRGHLAARAEEHHRQRLQAFCALGLGHVIRPFVAGKILAAGLRLDEVIQQQKAGGLRILAGGEHLKQILALAHFLTRV